MSDKTDGFCFSYVVKETRDKGLGVFACEPIKRGSIVWRHVPDKYVVYDEQTFKEAIEQMTRADVVYELTHVFGLHDFPGCLIVTSAKPRAILFIMGIPFGVVLCESISYGQITC